MSLFFKKREYIKITEEYRKEHGKKFAKLTHGLTHYEYNEGSCKTNIPGVVFIHGATIPMWVWDPEFQYMKKCGIGSLRYDLYGRGLSDKPQKIYNKFLFRKQLIELLDDLKIEKVNLVGHSVGGTVAADFTIHFPERVDKTFLVAPSIHHKRSKPILNLTKIPHVREMVVNHIVMERVISRAFGAFDTSLQKENYKQKFINQISTIGFERAFMSLIQGEFMEDQTFVYKELSEIKGNDSILIYGSLDEELPPKVLHDVMEDCPQMLFKKIEGHKHSMTFSAQEELNEFIHNYISKRERNKRWLCKM